MPFILRHAIQYKKGSDTLWIALTHYRARRQALAAAKDAPRKIAIYGIIQAWNLNKLSPKMIKDEVVLARNDYFLR